MSWEIQPWGAKEGVVYDFATGSASTAANACSVAGALAVYVMLAGALDVPSTSCSVAGSASSSYTFDANSNQAAGLITLPTGLTITCATTGRTSQASAATLQGSYGANAARAFRVDSGAWYLLSEHSSANDADDSNVVSAGSWSLAVNVSVTGVNNQSDPAGGSTADEITWTLALTGNGFFNVNGGGAADDFTASHWLKWASGSGNVKFQNAIGGSENAVVTPLTTWSRLSWYDSNSGNRAGEWVQKQVGSPDVIHHAFCMVELSKKYPSSYIAVVGTGSTSRAADVLAATAKAYRIPAGFFDVTLVYAPLYAQNETAADHTLLYIDATNKLIYRQSDSKFVLTIAGVDVVSSAVTFSRNQALTVQVKHQSATGLSLIVSGATTGNGTTNGAAQAAVVPSTVYLLGVAAGSEEGSALRSYDWKTSVAA